MEAYRRLAEGAVGRTVEVVEVADPRFIRGSATLADLVDTVTGRRILSARRRGKLLIVDLGVSEIPVYRHRGLGGVSTPPPRRLGLRFGMTGRLLLDGHGPIDRLLYTSPRDEPAWDRFGLRFTDGGTLVVRDPRLLGGVVLDPDESLLGPDAATVSLSELTGAVRGRATPLKTALLDQGRIAGIGNLMADELLWRAGLAPGRLAGSLTGAEIARLHRFVRSTVRMLVARGGSHTGDLMPARVPGGRCPSEGAALVRSIVGGRTTWWCPEHQH